MKKLFIGIILLGFISFVGWQNRVSLLMFGLPILLDLTDPIAEEGDEYIYWPN